MEGAIGKIPPQSLEAEQSLLGACLLEEDALNNALEFLRAEDFYRHEHRIIFSCMQKLAEEGTPCDLVTVTDALKDTGELEKAGGVAYVASLSNTLPTSIFSPHYARIISEKAAMRALIDAAGNIHNEGLSGGHTADELLELAEKSIFEVTQRNIHRNLYRLSEVAVDVIEEIEKIKLQEGVTGVPTFRDLDNKYLSGLQKSDLILLAARPGMGKTSMAVNIAQNAAIKHGKTVAIFSLEMSKEQLVQRMLCTLARVSQSRVRAGMASKEEKRKLSQVLGQVTNAELYMDDTPGITIAELRSKCRKLMVEKKKLDLVVIDYLQLMQGGTRRTESRQQEVADISRSLKALAKELDVPVLALSQLSRLAERSDEPPNLSFLRESGFLGTGR